MRKVLLVVLLVCAVVFAKSYTIEPVFGPKHINTNSSSQGAIKLGMGGPDAYGYIYIDSDTTCPGAPTFNWIDISSVGTLVTGLGDDNVVGPFNIGFDFPYYWYRVSSFYIGSNGYIAFGDNTLCASPFPSIPSTTRPNNMVAPLLSDLDFGTGEPSCYYWTNAANDTCIITYQNLSWWNSPSNCSLQIILAKPDSSITFQYKRIIGTPNGGWGAANSGNRTGIENFIGNVGLQYVNGTVPAQNDIHDNLAVKFIPPATTSYEARDASIWNAMNDISGGFFAYRDSAKTLWTNIKNSGTVTVPTCTVTVRVINDSNQVVYSNTVYTGSLNAGQQQLISFSPDWTPTENGLYRTIFKVRIDNDIFRGNDSVVIETHVVTYPVELAYDDGEVNQSSTWSGASGGYGMKFTPPKYPCVISGAKAMLQLSGTNPVGCTLYVFDDDGLNGGPGTVIAKRYALVNSNIAKWYRVFMDQETIWDGSFYVGVTQNDSGLAYSMDTDAPISGQTWEYTGVWSPYREKTADDFMARALIGYTPLQTDVTTLEINAPISMVNPGATITPRALIGNYGTIDQPNIPVVMKIDSAGTNVYTGTANIALNAAQEDYVNFTPNWTAGPFGAGYDITVYTSLAGDQDQTNDTLKSVVSAFYDSTRIRARFAAITPTIDGQVDEFEWSDTRKYDVTDMLGKYNGVPRKAGSAYLWMKHDTNYVYIAVITPHATSDDRADQVAFYFDENRNGVWEEDTSEGNYWAVNYPGALDTVTYRGWLPTTPSPTSVPRYPAEGTVVACTLYNGYMNYEVAIPKGNLRKSDLWFRPYLNADTMRFCMYSIDYPNSDFYAWWPQTMAGNAWYTPNAYGILFFQPPLYDVGVKQILEPVGTIGVFTTVIPKVIVKNYGQPTPSFPVIFKITEQKSDVEETVYVSLSAMQEDTVEFSPWQATTITTYQTEARVEMSGDMVASNNTLIGSFEVLPAVWTRLDDMAPGKIIKDGGALVGVSDGKTEALYAFRGSKSNEFYKYSSGAWSLSDSIKFGWKFNTPIDTTKINKKFPGKGAALCFDGDHTIYATKGNGTKEFWSYNITTGIWTQEEYVPVPKALKGGTSMVFYDGKVYLLAGSQKKTDLNNFYIFDCATKTWSTGGSLEIGPNQKVWKDGSSISLLNGTIYALKGGDKTNFFYAYNFGSSSWEQKEPLPLEDSVLGKYKAKVAVKDGAATAASNTAIYAIKGGGKNVFWKYTPGTPGTWTMMVKESIPRPTAKSVPKTGAAMAYLNGAIYLLKGNKTVEFWKFSPASEKSATTTSSASSTINSVMTENTTSTLKFNFDINPNPFTKLTTIRYTVPVSGNVTIKLYNASGRLVNTIVNDNLSAGSYSTNLQASKLAKGIYFLKYEDKTNKSELKLIVQ